jgi:uncharacterized protein YjeT (DUF2065 family)
MMFVNHRWQQLTRGLWSNPAEILATISGVVTIVGVVVAIVRWIAMAASVASRCAQSKPILLAVGKGK